jgi:hypothetical protein
MYAKPDFPVSALRVVPKAIQPRLWPNTTIQIIFSIAWGRRDFSIAFVKKVSFSTPLPTEQISQVEIQPS